MAYFTLRRALVGTGNFVYCVVLFLAFDLLFSSLTSGEENERSVRIANPIYDHGFAANFDGHGIWGDLRYPLTTNNLGFKDATVRDVPLKSDSRRILLIGDSFTEAIGLNFEDSFAGQLYRAGQQRSERIEFLNAGVASYSPIIYFKKIKSLLEHGLQFDEVVVFSDSSDVNDEATTYFCIDDNPIYRAHCTSAEGSMQAATTGSSRRDFLVDRFVVTNRIRVFIQRAIFIRNGNKRRKMDGYEHSIGWTLPGPSPSLAKDNEPLGVDGGIARSLQNMRALYDLLAPRNIPLTIVVYPWPHQIAQGDRDSRQIDLWREFCHGRCKAFINLYPPFFAAAEANKDWYEQLFILGDFHFSAAGNKLFFREIAKHLL